jgi:hypothetical protein
LTTTAVLAGVTETALAQMVTLEPFTCEPNLWFPTVPPEFLQAAKLGSGTNVRRLNISAKPR